MCHQAPRQTLIPYRRAARRLAWDPRQLDGGARKGQLDHLFGRLTPLSHEQHEAAQPRDSEMAGEVEWRIAVVSREQYGLVGVNANIRFARDYASNGTLTTRGTG